MIGKSKKEIFIISELIATSNNLALLVQMPKQNFELEREKEILMNTITEEFKDKTLVITGGMGSFGSTALKHFLTTDIGEIRIISSDEKKQDWRLRRNGIFI